MGGYWGAGDHGTEKERGHVTKVTKCGKRERESLRVFYASETLADGREMGEGKRPQTKLGVVLPRKAGCSLGRPESDHLP